MTPKDQAGTHPSRVSRSSWLDWVSPIGISFKTSWGGHFHSISTARPGRKNPLAAWLRQLSLQGITLFYRDFPLFLQTTGTIFFPKFSKKKARYREISLVQGQRDYSAMEGILI